MATNPIIGGLIKNAAQDKIRGAARQKIAKPIGLLDKAGLVDVGTTTSPEYQRIFQMLKQNPALLPALGVANQQQRVQTMQGSSNPMIAGVGDMAAAAPKQPQTVLNGPNPTITQSFSHMFTQPQVDAYGIKTATPMTVASVNEDGGTEFNTQPNEWWKPKPKPVYGRGAASGGSSGGSPVSTPPAVAQPSAPSPAPAPADPSSYWHSNQGPGWDR